MDHPAFGAALLGRHLESLGFRVGILPQPDWRTADAFRRFGPPRLFFGVTAGNLDSAVAHYTPDRRRREKDSYSPGGRTGLRPDYASVVYSHRCREAFPDSVIVMGGIEASLRRLAHYDFVQEKVRRSILIDAKADFLVYGMAERALGELARALREGKDRGQLEQIPGLAYRTSSVSEDAGGYYYGRYRHYAYGGDGRDRKTGGGNRRGGRAAGLKAWRRRAG